jgi:hypothetical protein
MPSVPKYFLFAEAMRARFYPEKGGKSKTGKAVVVRVWGVAAWREPLMDTD